MMDIIFIRSDDYCEQDGNIFNDGGDLFISDGGSI